MTNKELISKIREEILHLKMKELQRTNGINTGADVYLSSYAVLSILSNALTEESEDERIRKVIYKLMLGMREEIFTSQDEIVTKEKALAYLEKKPGIKIWPHEIIDAKNGEHDPADIYSEDGRLIAKKDESEDERIRKWLVEYFGSIKETVWIHRDITCEQILAWLEKQKEQKHPSGCFTCDEYKKGYEEGRRNGFTAGYNKAMKEVEQKEQKPTATINGEPISAENHSVDIPLVEWSEEDEDYMNAIIAIINRETALYPKGGATEDLNNDLIAWLKSLRPSWKPTEEQMRCFDIALALSDETMDENLHNVLVQLREQLKKL